MGAAESVDVRAQRSALVENAGVKRACVENMGVKNVDIVGLSEIISVDGAHPMQNLRDYIRARPGSRMPKPRVPLT